MRFFAQQKHKSVSGWGFIPGPTDSDGTCDTPPDYVIPQYFHKSAPRTDRQKIVKLCRKSPFLAVPILV